MKVLSFIANCHGIFQLNIKRNALSSAKLLVDHCSVRSVQHCYALLCLFESLDLCVLHTIWIKNNSIKIMRCRFEFRCLICHLF